MAAILSVVVVVVDVVVVVVDVVGLRVPFWLVENSGMTDVVGCCWMEECRRCAAMRNPSARDGIHPGWNQPNQLIREKLHPARHWRNIINLIITSSIIRIIISNYQSFHNHYYFII